MSSIVGVDPGGRQTGIVVRDGDHVLAGAVLTRASAGKIPDQPYLEEVVTAAMGYVNRFGGRVAVEGLNAPTGFHHGQDHPIDPAGLIGVAMVLGAVLAMFPDAVVVEPGQHGSSPLATYPRALIGVREAKGTGKRRHVRSAWDVAGVAARMVRSPLRAV